VSKNTLKNIIITGVSSGFGYYISQEFLSKGWSVIGVVKNQTDFNLDTMKTLSKSYTSFDLYNVDVSSDTEVSTLFENITSKYPKIDALVNNAGFGFLGPIETFTSEDIIEQYNVNVLGYHRMIKGAVPLMKKNGGGKIINIGSVNGLVSFPLYGIYSSSKFAIETMSEVLDFELRPFNIRSVVIEPGVFATDFSKNTKFTKGLKGSDYESWADSFWSRVKGKVQFKSFPWLTDPKRVAKLVYRVVTKRSVRVRYKIGLDTYIFPFLRKLLPYEVWRFCVNLIYRWK